jgi:hypothetical protein
MGNHDAEGPVSRRDFMHWHAATGGSVSRLPRGVDGPDFGNYWIDIQAPRKREALLRLWMFDSGNRGCGGVPGWCVVACSVFVVNSYEPTRAVALLFVSCCCGFLIAALFALLCFALAVVSVHVPQIWSVHGSPSYCINQSLCCFRSLHFRVCGLRRLWLEGGSDTTASLVSMWLFI